MKVEFGGSDSVRPAQEIIAEEFISVKSFKAKGKRLTNYTLGNISELEPLPVEEPEEIPEVEEVEIVETDEKAPETDLAQEPPTNPVSPKTIQKGLFDDLDE